MDLDIGNELKEILRCNPFLAKIAEWEEVLDKIANKKAPYDFSPYDPRGENQFKFCLSGDEYRLRETPQVCTGYIPQPFIGHPSAPIWLLNQNPSPFNSDVYAMFDVSKEGSALAETEIVRVDKGVKKVSRCRIHATENPDHRRIRLLNRQRLMLEQLKLEKDIFFSLEKVFDIGEDVKVSDEGSQAAKTSMYSWWKSFLVGRDYGNFPFGRIFEDNGGVTRLARSCFVMEAFPYRSKNWSDAKKVWREGPYHLFWEKMVKYACEHGKILIVRAGIDKKNKEVCDSVLVQAIRGIARSCAKDSVSAKLYGFGNCEHISFSNRNVVVWPRGWDEKDRKGFGILLNALQGLEQRKELIKMSDGTECSVEEALTEMKVYGRHNLLRDRGVEERKDQRHAHRAQHQPNDAGNGTAGKRLYRIPEGEYQYAEAANISTIMRHVAKRYLDLNPDKSRLDFLNMFRGGVNEGMVPDTEDWREKTRQSVEAIVFSGKGGSRLGEKILHGLKIRFCGN